ncbi:carboxypeptidase-like regulatory domain-containing protein [Jejudonia soesokkakensis]|uniref:Carboxypeptidase-like regulatory domain-containing protein n=1 Tax=Jejudonia soesokkakensis TaxID=1323432 RepID=A0ABW2MVU6_9FLAO
MKQLLLILLCAIPFFVGAQQIERTLVNGKITAPEGESVDGINIYNTSSQKGTVTDEEGLFTIEVAKNDRVQVTSIQYQSFTIIVDEGIISSKSMKVYLNPAVNQLAEVIVRPYDLTGNIKVDVGKIKTVDLDTEWALDYKAWEFEYGFVDDGQTAIRGNKAEEAYYNGQKQNGANIIGGVGLLARLIFGKPDKRKTPKTEEEKLALATNLTQRFSPRYIESFFGIPQSKAADFINFLEDKGIETSLLKSENELELLDFMFARADAFKKQMD